MTYIQLYRNTVRQKVVYAGQVLRVSSGINDVLMLEGKIDDERTRGWPTSNRIDDIEEWTNVKDYSGLKRGEEDGKR